MVATAVATVVEGAATAVEGAAAVVMYPCHALAMHSSEETSCSSTQLELRFDLEEEVEDNGDDEQWMMPEL